MLLLTQKLFKHIPNSYPMQCEDGWLLETNENETRINCTNSLCPIDNAMKLDSALDILEIDCKVGPSKALELTINMELDNHMDIFNRAYALFKEGYQFENSLTGSNITVLNAVIDFLSNIDKRPVDFYKFMQCWGLEQLGATNSQKIFRSLSGAEDLYSMFDENPFKLKRFISDKMNIAISSNTVRIIESFLLENRERITETAEKFKFKPTKTGTIGITITGEINKNKRSDGTKYKPRKKFAEELSDKYDININYTDHITQETDFLICDNNNGHTKINKVKSNPAFSKVRAVDSLEFEEIIKSIKENKKIKGFN